jgi:hypothetical protein
VRLAFRAGSSEPVLPRGALAGARPLSDGEAPPARTLFRALRSPAHRRDRVTPDLAIWLQCDIRCNHAGRKLGLPGRGAGRGSQPSSLLTFPPSSLHLLIPISAGARIPAESRCTRARQPESSGGASVREGRALRPAGCGPSHVQRGRGRNRVLAASSPPRRRLLI